MTGAVVIGSGPNGLAAAITLAEAGRDVTVLEAADRAGGAVATDELTLPGFRHDTYSAVFPAAAASPVFGRWPLARHGLRWIQPRHCYAHPLPDGRAVVLTRDLDETAASLDALAPGDGAAWREFALPYVRHFDAWRSTLMGGFPPVAGSARMLAALGPRAMLDWSRLLLMPADALARRLFSGDAARAWLYGSAMHGDVPPQGAGSAIAAVHLNLMGHAVGWPSPEGGAERLAAALTGHLEELGGRVRTGAPVTRVIVERGRVTGVEVAGEERVPARLVVADLTPHGLLRARRRRAAATLRRAAARLPLRPVDAQGRLGAVGPDPVDRAGGPAGGHRARRRRRGGDARRAPQRRRPDRRSSCSASRRSAIRRARPTAGTRPGPTRTDRTTRRGSRPSRTWSGSSSRSSASRPASAT